MKSAFYIWAFVLITSLVTLGLCIRCLALKGVPVSESLIVRGASCLFCVVAFARLHRLTLRPASLRTQTLRALIAGLALTFLSLSYSWLSASAVSVLSNVDVPLLVALGPLVGVATGVRARLLSLASILLLVVYVISLEATQETLLFGVGTLLIGSLLLCFGYFFVKKSMTDENRAVAILTPALAILVYGLFEKLVIPSSSVAWNYEMWVMGLLSGASMFTAYIATMKLYALTDLAKAEFPALLTALVIQPIESFLSNEPMSWNFLLLTCGFVIVTYFIVNLQKDTSREASRGV